MTRTKEDDEKELAYFHRRCDAARAGTHLPTLKELLLGCPFMEDDLQVDCQTFAERVLPKVDRQTRAGRALAKTLERMTVGAATHEFVDASRSFLRTVQMGGLVCPAPETCAARCLFYAAASGCRESALRVACLAMSFVYDGASTDYDKLEFAAHATGWLLYAAPLVPSVFRRFGNFADFGEPRNAAEGMGDRVAAQIERSRKSVARRQGEDREDEPTEPRRGPRFGEGERAPGDQQSCADKDVPRHVPDGIVVLERVGNADTTEGRRTLKEFEKLLDKPLPLVRVPDLADLRLKLLSEFPHATGVVAAFIDALSTHVHVKLSPIVLVGSPGCGKTTFAARLLELLGVPCETFSCGGVSDSALAGTARRWSTGEPSLPVALVKRHAIASPGIVLDEVEKVGTSRRNGNLLDALLGLLEPQSAARWHDVYIEAAVDLSHVVWIATANSLEGVQAPLRDRCRIIEFPDPGPEHVETLAARLLVKAYARRGLDERWVLPLDDDEVEALRNFWQGGSIRRLARLVDGVVSARERDRVVH